MRLPRLGSLLAMLPLSLAAPAAASDGVLQINQACAVQTGCFTGDTAGYPVSITIPGSYVLTSNLVLPNSSISGIAVSAPSVHIDLNGFEITSAGCLGATTDCTPTSGASRGVMVTSFTLSGVVVENGSITGMAMQGVYLGRQATASRLRVRWNGGHGIQVDVSSIVSGNTVQDNVGTGIYTESNATVSDNAVYFCNEGIRVYAGSIVTGNTVTSSAGAGIRADNHSAVIEGNSTVSNGSYGIITSHAATITGNHAALNQADGISAGRGSKVSGNVARANNGDGIYADVGSSVSDNTAWSNGIYGLVLESTATYRENTVVGNSAAAVLGGVNRGDNYCNGTGVVSDTCP